MKLTSVELHPSGSSNVCELSFQDPRRVNPFNIRTITGLDADEIVARYYGGVGESAPKFYNLSLESRTIVVRIELNPSLKDGETYSDLRDELYRLIASSRTGVVQLRFKNGDDTIAAISGFVSKFEASHFAKNPEAQLSINCVDPILRALEPVVINASELDPAQTIIVDAESTAPHGFKFAIAFTDAVPLFSIGDVDWDFEIAYPGGFLTGDVLHYSNEQDSKYLYLVRDFVTTHLADRITPNSVWPIIFPGENTLSCGNPTRLDWISVSHYPAYWGV